MSPATWVALWMAIATAGCQRSGQASTEDLVPGLKLEGVQFRVYRGNALRATGRTARADYRRDTDELLARNLTAALPDPTRGDARVGAALVEGKLKAGTFTASGGLLLERADATARTASARYEPGPPAVIRGDEAVTVEGTEKAAWRLTGTGFTVDTRSGDLVVGGGVRLDARTAEAGK